MKALSGLILIFLSITSILSSNIVQNYSYDDFMGQFGRNYEGQEKTIHEAIFNQKYAELIKRNNNGGDFKVNNFMDWTDAQWEKFNNYRPHLAKNPLSSPSPLSSSGLFASPISFDWRKLNKVTDIKNQGQCGSCWSFSSTAQYESLRAIATNGTKYDLAEQFGIQCEKVHSTGCDGGYPIQALKVFNTKGIPLQTQYPYKGSSDNYYLSRNISICSPDSTVKLAVPTLLIQNFANLTSSLIQQYLSTYGPMTVAVYASGYDFENAGPKTSISCSGTNAANHAILLVGYNSTHWIIKNSWGTNWGDNGFGYILRSADCGLSKWVDVMQVNYGFNPAPSPNPSPSPTPTPTPTDITKVSLTISMTDSYGDGWNGNILGLRQNGVVIGTFGKDFTSGATTASVNITVSKDLQVEVVVVQIGSYTKEVGFVIKASNGSVIYQRLSGTSFTGIQIFKKFCLGTCPVATTIDVYVTMTDSYGDTWNGNMLAFKQSSGLQNFSLTSNGVTTYGPVKFTLQKQAKIEIIVSKMGQWTEEVGFEVRTYNGILIFSRASGTQFYANSLLGTFCSDCINLAPVPSLSASTSSLQIRPIDQSANIESERSSKNKFMVSTIVMSSIAGLLIIFLAILSFKLYKTLQKIKLISQQSQSRKAPSMQSANEKLHV